MKLQGRPAAAFDPDGLIFAAGINSESVKLYDLRSFDKGPFSSFRFNGENKIFRPVKLTKFCLVDNKDLEWTGLKFSPDGKSILISTNGSVIKLIDSYTGLSLQTFTGKLVQFPDIDSNDSSQDISTLSSFHWRLPSLRTLSLLYPGPATVGSISGILKTARKFVFSTEII